MGGRGADVPFPREKLCGTRPHQSRRAPELHGVYSGSGHAIGRLSSDRDPSFPLDPD